MLSGAVRKVSEEFFNGYMSAVYGRVWGLGFFDGTSECAVLV